MSDTQVAPEAAVPLIELSKIFTKLEPEFLPDTPENTAKQKLYDALGSPLLWLAQNTTRTPRNDIVDLRSDVLLAEIKRQDTGKQLSYDVEILKKVSMIPGRLELMASKIECPKRSKLKAVLDQRSTEVFHYERGLSLVYNVSHNGLTTHDLTEQSGAGLSTAETFYSLFIADIYSQLVYNRVPTTERPRHGYALLQSKMFLAGLVTIAGNMHLRTHFNVLLQNTNQKDKEAILGRYATLNAARSPFIVGYDSETNTSTLGINRQNVKNFWTSNQRQGNTDTLGCPARKAVRTGDKIGDVTSGIQQFVTNQNAYLQTQHAFEAYETHIRRMYSI